MIGFVNLFCWVCYTNRTGAGTGYVVTHWQCHQGLVAFFVWDFQIQHTDPHVPNAHSAYTYGTMGSTIGIAMMAGYVVVDSFTSNLEEPLLFAPNSWWEKALSDFHALWPSPPLLGRAPWQDSIYQKLNLQPGHMLLGMVPCHNYSCDRAHYEGQLSVAWL